MTNQVTKQSFITVGDIAQRLDQPVCRVVRVISDRRIEHIGRAGNIRIFDESGLAAVAIAILAIDTNPSLDEGGRHEYGPDEAASAIGVTLQELRELGYKGEIVPVRT